MNTPLIAVSLFSLGLVGCDHKAPPKPVVASAVSTANAAEEKEDEKTDSTAKGPAAAVAAAEADAAEEKPSERAPRVPKDEFPRKMTEWKLSPEEIEAELTKTGRVVREKPAVAANKKSKEPEDDGHTATVISIKYGADPHLFATKISVTVDGGVATLMGSVKSPELIGRAIFLALNTDGIGQVVSLLTADSGK